MNRYLAVVLMIFGFISSSAPICGQEINKAIEFNLPPQVRKCFEASPLSKTHEISSHLNPYYLQGDFNGDGKLDTAVLVKEKKSGKFGIAIFHGGSKHIFLIGAGKTFRNYSDGGDNFDWLDEWYVFVRGPVGKGASEGIPPNLKGDALYVGKEGSASLLIYWNGHKYSDYQQGD